MKYSFKIRVKKLEKDWSEGADRHKKKALILCDSELPRGFTDFDVDAEVVLIAPDNGRRGPGKIAPKGCYSVYYV